MKCALFFGLLVALTCPIFAQKADAAPSPIDGSSQLIVVTTPNWNAVDGRLQRYQRSSPGQPWNAVGEAIQVVVGERGMGWGLGVVPTDHLQEADDPVKHEGDKKAPAGVFGLGSAFGFAAQAPAGWTVPYLALTPSTDCVDDAHSNRYNTIADRSTVTPDWESAEHMRSVGEAYRWGVVIDQNAAPAKKNAGSCVFMHVWGGAGVGTAGCTAMPQQQIESILAWLNPSAHPLLVQMPIGQYLHARESLHLPALPGGNSN
jgi:D-alanyl-D-alanine dipeptidase